MNRDLVFFVAGLSFGIAAGYFTFRAVGSGGGLDSPVAAVSTTPGAAESSAIGLDQPSYAPLDEE